MSQFGWDACSYGLLLLGFLGAEVQRQRHGSLPRGPRRIHRLSAVMLLVWPLALGVCTGDQMTAHEQLATVSTPFVLLLLFCVHMACRAAWREWFARRDQERERE